ncbi:hypothetical protein L580_2855 [Serratia fonticola AU-P3(3)]|nr:hypothetical protein L580_2855 [Serratia fonticola AU-P3(3)]
MTLSSQRFTVYDIRQFPLVIMRNQAIVPGYTKRWEEELNNLIAQALPFVIVFPPNRPKEESNDDRKCRMRWFKANKEKFGRVCRALISVEPDAKEREQQMAHAKEMMKFFGTPLETAATLEEALTLGEKLISGDSC